MKLVILLTTVACLQAWSKTQGQTITLAIKNAPLEKVFKAIRSQTGYSFIYTKEVLDGTQPVSIDVKDAEIKLVLDLCFSSQPLSYTILENQVVIKRKKESVTFPESSTSLLNVRGRVANEKEEPVEGATVAVKGSRNATATNADGFFELKQVDEKATLVFSGVNIETTEISLKGRTDISITVRSRIIQGEEVIVNTGYQRIKPNEATGSFDVVNNQLLNRRVSTNVLDRIENLTPGVSFKNPNDGILIRGRSTIFSNASPLIVVDHFPYDGDINNLNPNDVESITILKDAAAASVWGARAGNGVIVITTKHGKSAKPKVEWNSSLGFQKKPNLSNLGTISSADYIDLEKYLFSKGYYATDELFNQFGVPHAFTPVVELLIAERDGKIPATDADAQIESFKAFNSQNDISDYLYRNALTQQNSISVSAASPNINYYISAGWDRNSGAGNLVGARNDRITLHNQTSFRVNKKLNIDLSTNFTRSNNQTGNNPGYTLNTGNKGLYPYARLADNNGNPLELIYNNRKIFTDTATGNGQLLNWQYYPVEDINKVANSNKVTDYLIAFSLKYQLAKVLDLQIKYQYENSINTFTNRYSASSYFSRNLINSFYQPSAVNHFPIPFGGIRDENTNEIIAHQGRVQLGYNQAFGLKNRITAIAGWEIKDMTTNGINERFYGYKEDGSLVNATLDYTTSFTAYNDPFSSYKIPTGQNIYQNLDRFISYYLNGSYTYDSRYILSLSGRNDAANLFGVRTNQKGVPLWSAGMAWQVSNEKFYKSDILPYLKLRTSYGYNGNFSRIVSALPTISFGLSNFTPATTATIQSPPNADLRWEQVRIMNIGLDFETRNKTLTGTVEFYKKKAKDLIAPAPVDPTLGLLIGSGGTTSIYRNIASMKGHGLEINFNSKNIDRKFKWFTNFNFSTAFSEVTEYLMPVSSNGSIYLNANSLINPTRGKPVYTVYSYYWAGLDPVTGDPLGYQGKTVSRNWSSITSTTRLDSLQYNGSAQPTYFGALMNTIGWKNISVSFMLSYKGGYYFRRPSVNYGSLFSNWTGNSDYALRWQKAGDEKITNVPSLMYPVNNSRDNFYTYSGILVEKGDHIRFEDIRLSYTINRAQVKSLPFQQLQVYTYISNLGLVWAVNDRDIDPYYVGTPKPSNNLSVGLTIIF